MENHFEGRSKEELKGINLLGNQVQNIKLNMIQVF